VVPGLWGDSGPCVDTDGSLYVEIAYLDGHGGHFSADLPMNLTGTWMGEDMNTAGLEYTVEIESMDASKTDTGHWQPVSVYYDTVSGQNFPLLTYSLPTAFDPDTGNCTSAMSVDVSITWLRDQLRSMATRGNELYIVDTRSMRLVGSSLSESDLPSSNVAEEVPWTVPDTPNAHVNAVLSRVVSEYNGDLAESSAELILTNVEKYIIAATHVIEGDLHWMVISRTPRSYYFGPSQTVFNVSIAVSVVVVLISAGSFLALHFAVTRPISRMLEMMLSISKLQDADVLRETPILHELQPLHQELNRLDLAVQSFARYVPRDVVRDLISSNELCQLQMLPVHCSMMFMDIRGFTTISERVPISQLNAIVQKYFERMSMIVLDHDGVIDKYIGDCIMAVWGVPLAVHEAPAKCALAAVRLAREVNVDPLRSAFDDVGEQLAVRIGAASGEVLAGNMGCLFRMNYTVIGDHVNLAARLEALNKKFGSVVMCDGNTLQGAARRLFCTRFLGRISVAGKSEAEKVYEVLGLAPLPATTVDSPQAAHRAVVIDSSAVAAGPAPGALITSGSPSPTRAGGAANTAVTAPALLSDPDTDGDNDDAMCIPLNGSCGMQQSSKYKIDVALPDASTRWTYGSNSFSRGMSGGMNAGTSGHTDGAFASSGAFGPTHSAAFGPMVTPTNGNGTTTSIEGSYRDVATVGVLSPHPSPLVAPDAMNLSSSYYSTTSPSRAATAAAAGGARPMRGAVGGATTRSESEVSTTKDVDHAAAFARLVTQARVAAGCTVTPQQQQYAAAFTRAARLLGRGELDRAVRALRQLPTKFHPPFHPGAVLPAADEAREYLLSMAVAVQSDPVKAEAFDGVMVQNEK
jgi:class 3 adenylate cyclase